jgi:UDP-N-acetylmuramoyl-L-alanyl-D-glutamate--2,6-diaminopimelate ligase
LSETERIDLAPIDVWCGFGETRVTLAESPLAAALGGALTLRTTGRVHVANALAAALAASAAGYPAEAIRSGLAAFSPVAGRFELVTPDATRPRVVVDYAHTPDGLLGTLDTARALLAAEAASRAGPAGRVVLVFGCGGGRDRGKRPEMGAVADALADRVFLTSDNPRGEAPAAIAAEVLAGVPAPRASWRVEHDRAVAIAAAIAEAGPEDAVVIAGKGHEETQIFADGVRPFRDRAVALAALGLPARS